MTVPTLSVGGWNDPYADAVPRAYERLTVPKKLIMGPWGHVLPHESPTDPIDFLTIALRWWNLWLRGIDDGFMDEPPVLVHVQGYNARWHAFDEWPPGKDRLTFVTGARGVLTASADTALPAGMIAEYHPDPTSGALSGLRGVAAGASRPVDLQTDDLRALQFTTEPLPTEVVLCGRTEVLVRTDPTCEPPRRLVVRLTDVAPDDRSTLIADGIHRPGAPTAENQVMLGAAAYRLPAGHRIRVVIGDSDFPRLTPLPHPSGFQVTGVSLSLAVVDEADHLSGRSLPVTTGRGGQRPHRSGWRITRDADSVEIDTGGEPARLRTADGHLLDTSSAIRARVHCDSPAAAVLTATHTGTAQFTTGETVAGRVTLRCTQTWLDVHATLRVDDLTTYDNTWSIPLTPRP